MGQVVPIRRAYRGRQSTRYYRDHPDYAGEVDHADLVQRLSDYDGWALCTAARSLQDVLALCPAGTRVMVWCKPGLVQIPGVSIAHGWEPVLVYGGRRVPDSMVRDWILCAPPHWQWSTRARPDRPKEAVTGMKPDAYCRWVFEALGARPGDTLDDLFPGSGAVTAAWERFIGNPQLDWPVSPVALRTGG
jgi:hypothetical protein